MIHTEESTAPHLVLKDITCDRCGESCIKFGCQEFAHLQASWGYGSNQDGAKYDFHICETCFQAFLELLPADRRKPEDYVNDVDE